MYILSLSLFDRITIVNKLKAEAIMEKITFTKVLKIEPIEKPN